MIPLVSIFYTALGLLIIGLALHHPKGKTAGIRTYNAPTGMEWILALCGIAVVVGAWVPWERWLA